MQRPWNALLQLLQRGKITRDLYGFLLEPVVSAQGDLDVLFLNAAYQLTGEDVTYLKI